MFARMRKTLGLPGECTRTHTKVPQYGAVCFCVANCLKYLSQIKHRDRGFKSAQCILTWTVYIACVVCIYVKKLWRKAITLES
jgi:hypothetical protein